MEEQQHKDELKKANTKELKAANKLYNDKLAEEKREQAAQGTKERAEKKAQERRDINARKEQRRLNKEKKDHEKALQLSQRGKRKAVQSAAPKKKQKVGAAAARSHIAAAETPPAPRTHKARSGRTATLYN